MKDDLPVSEAERRFFRRVNEALIREGFPPVRVPGTPPSRFVWFGLGVMVGVLLTAYMLWTGAFG